MVKVFWNCLDLTKFAALFRVAVKSILNNGLVAQLDRAPDYGSGGWGFDSSLVHSEYQAVTTKTATAFFMKVQTKVQTVTSLDQQKTSRAVPERDCF
jgi:hypothetical protein